MWRMESSEPKAPDFETRLMMRQILGRRRYQELGYTCWPEELPSEEEYTRVRHSLEEHDWAVDYIITHCAPTNLAMAINCHNEANPFTDFLQEIREKARYHYWLFGHSHRNQAIDNKHILLWGTDCAGHIESRQRGVRQSYAVFLFAVICRIRQLRAGKREVHEYPKACCLQCDVHWFGSGDAKENCRSWSCISKSGNWSASEQKKGAEVAAAEYLAAKHSNNSGFSPRNLFRMRDFFCTYETASNIRHEALMIGWTQNVVIL